MSDVREALKLVKLLMAGLVLVSVGVIMGLVLSTSMPGEKLRGMRSEASVHAMKTAVGDEIPPVLLEAPRTGGARLTSPFADVARKVVPGVVSIESRRMVNHPKVEGPRGDLFRRMFPEGEEEGEFEVPSSGSGFLFDPAGYIFTNDHVVAGSDRVTVRLADGRDFDAWVVGTDPGTDVAVIKIELPAGGPALPILPLGDSEEIGVGDWAIAVGNPLGELEGTVTVGVVSAKGRRDLQIAGGGPTYQDFIQTDASINFGNSGGPLVNSRGEVVGINSAVNPTSQGIGFAIPMNMARKVGVELIRSGTVRRGYLGIIPQEVTREVREVWDLAQVQGILVGNVEPETPAADAGLQVGDVILDFNGETTSDVPTFRALVAESGVGIEVPVTVLREGKQKKLEVTLAERPDTQAPPQHGAPIEPGEDWLGADMEAISPELAQEYELDRQEGVVVTRVTLSGAAARGGLREGDIILEVNRERVRDENQLKKELANAHRARKPAVLLVERGGITTFISVRPQG